MLVLRVDDTPVGQPAESILLLVTTPENIAVVDYMRSILNLNHQSFMISYTTKVYSFLKKPPVLHILCSYIQPRLH